jgi:hypothetical protein
VAAAREVSTEAFPFGDELDALADRMDAAPAD